MNKARIIFMGSPDYAVPALKMLHAQFNLTAVVTQPDQPVGRGKKIQAPPVKIIAQELDVPIFQPAKVRGAEFMELLRTLAPDVIIVAAYGKILPEAVLEFPSFGCLNLHASLLPRWRGASPIQNAILHGDEKTGVTIMKMDRGVDTGAIFQMREVSIEPDDTAGSLSEKLAVTGAALLEEILPKYFDGTISAQEQPEEGATYAQLLHKEDGRMDFSKEAEELERQVRAFNPWPVSFMEWKAQPLRVLRAELTGKKSNGCGKRTIVEKFPCIGTASVDLKLVEVQPAGKRPMRGSDFLNGARDWAD